MVAGYQDAINALNPVHYFPLNNTYSLQDVVGSTVADPAGARGTNYKNFTHGVPTSPTVTFQADGAHFPGTANGWLTAPTDRGFSVDSTASTSDTTTITVAFWINFPNYTQNNGGDNLHFFAKGDSGSSHWMEWAMRTYSDGSPAGRDRNISNYYWNPNVSVDPQGNPVASNRGSGAFMAPPEGARTPFNSPTGSGAINTWHLIFAEWKTTPGDQTNSSPRGTCKIFYGSSANAVAQCGSTRGMDADANIGPKYNNGPLTLGRRIDSTWTLTATVRRAAFWNRALTLTEMETLRQAHITYGNTEGDVLAAGGGGGGGGGGTFDETPGAHYDTGATAAGAWTKTVTVPAMAANTTHFIACSLNAATMDTTGGGIATPSGYTRLTPADPTFSGTSVAGLIVFYKTTATATTATTAVIAATGTTATTGRVAIVDFTMSDTASVTAGTYNTAAASTTLNTATITPTSGQKVLAFYGLKETTVSSNGITFSAPATGYSIVDQDTSANATNTNAAVAVVSEDVASTGTATGALSLTSTDSGSWGAMTARVTKVSVALISTFTNPLTTFNATTFTRSSDTEVNVSGGAVSITAAAGSTNSLLGNTTYSIDESSVYARVIHSPGTASAATQFLVQNAADATKDLGFRIFTDSGGVRTMQVGSRTSAVFDAGSTTAAYDPSTMAYLRIRESGSTVTFETSSNTTSWTTFGTLTSPAWVGGVKTYWTAARSTGATGSMTASTFSSINTAPSGDPAPSADVFDIQQLVDQFGSEDTSKWIYDGATATGGSARVPATATEAQVRSRDYWNLQNSSFEVHVTPSAGGTNPTTKVIVQDSATVGTGVQVSFDGSNATASLISGGNPVGASYSFAWTAGQRLRIREGTFAGGTANRIYVDSGVWDVNTQSFLWTLRTTTPFTSPAWVTSTRVLLTARNTSGSSSTALFDDVNSITPQGSPAGPPVSDTFEDGVIDSAKWTAYGTPVEGSGVLTLDAANEGLLSKTSVNLTGQKQFVQLTAVTTAAGDVSVFRLERDASNHLQFRFEGGQVFAEYVVSGVKTTLGSVAFDTTATRFVQIREAGGTVFFEYGSSTTGMTTLGSVAAPLPVTALYVRMERSA